MRSQKKETTKAQKMGKQLSRCVFINHVSEHVPRELQTFSACDIKPLELSHYHPEVERQRLKRRHGGVGGFYVERSQCCLDRKQI